MINKNHHKYPEAMQKVRDIAKEEKKEMLEAYKNPRFHLDNMERKIREKYNKKIKELQKEYSFLFED